MQHGAMVWAAAVAAAMLAGAEVPARGPQQPATELIYYDGPGPDGELGGGAILGVVPQQSQVAGGPPAGVTTLISNGPPANRIDLVFVGDGYRTEELDLFASQVQDAIEEIFAERPLSDYASYFNVHRVDVVSQDSGVDNDPVPGIERDTAMDMGFWCNGIEQLLCIDVATAFQMAGAAPGADHVVALANSQHYGGAGYTHSDVATISAGHPQAWRVALHELGHSLGGLADEYYENDGSVYEGREPGAANVSIFQSEEMAAMDLKWAAWLGADAEGLGAPVGTYEGGLYHQYGIFRPTPNSRMKTLSKPFNPPSIEAIVVEIYRLLDPIDAATPTAQPLGPDDTVLVDPLDPVGWALSVSWALDGQPLNHSGTQLQLGPLELEPGVHELAATVRDETALVRGEKARQETLTQMLLWEIAVPPPGDLDGDMDVDGADLAVLLTDWGPCGAPCPADLTGDGQVGVADLVTLLALWG